MKIKYDGWYLTNSDTMEIVLREDILNMRVDSGMAVQIDKRRSSPIGRIWGESPKRPQPTTKGE